MHRRSTKGKKFSYLFVSDSKYELTGILTHQDINAFIEEEGREVREWVETNATKGQYRFEVQKSWFAGDVHRKRYAVRLAEESVAAMFKIRWC